MEHPLLNAKNKALRSRVLQLIKDGYSIPRSSNIIFVCGGNDVKHMRPRFFEFCEQTKHEYEIFKPEFAIENIFADGGHEPFNIAQFEKLVGELSKAIVVFPEAAGSFAETGYFSAIDSLAEKTILIMDSEYQNGDSFISMGPAKLIENKSKFYPVIQSSYLNPNFQLVFDRIASRHKETKMKYLTLGSFKDLNSFELMCLAYSVATTLRICTIEDIVFIMTALFKGRLSKPKIWQILSVLIGAGFLISTGEHGHYLPAKDKKLDLKVKDGFIHEEQNISLELVMLFEDDSPELNKLLEDA